MFEIIFYDPETKTKMINPAVKNVLIFLLISAFGIRGFMLFFKDEIVIIGMVSLLALDLILWIVCGIIYLKYKPKSGTILEKET